MKSLYRLFAVLALVLATAGMLATPASAAAPKCPTGWGSTPTSLSASDHAALTKISTGRHGCYDRVVFQVLGASRGEAGILGEGVRQALLRDPTYKPALSAARAMVA